MARSFAVCALRQSGQNGGRARKSETDDYGGANGIDGTAYGPNCQINSCQEQSRWQDEMKKEFYQPTSSSIGNKRRRILIHLLYSYWIVFLSAENGPSGRCRQREKKEENLVTFIDFEITSARASDVRS